MSAFCRKQTELPSSQYGWYEPSYDNYPDERRWAKRFALYKLREVIRNFSFDYNICIVKDLMIVQHIPEIESCGTCVSASPYTWGWKCRFILANKP